MIRFRITILTIFSLLFTGAILAGNVKISVETPGAGNKVGKGETFHIVITATDCPGEMDLDSYPAGVKVVYNSSSQSMSMTTDASGTHRRVSTTLTLTCKAVSEGKYTFGPVKVGGVTSNKVTYEVTASSQGGSVKSGNMNSQGSHGNTEDDSDEPKFIGKGNDEIFLKASVNKTSAYEQEAIVYTVKLYTTYEPIKFLGATAAPKFDGFVVEESKDVSTSLSFESYNGKNYATAIIARYIIFPQKAGKLKIQGNTYTVSTDARQYYHDPFYQTMTVRRPIQLNVTPNDLVIDVRALPQPQPVDFSGAVGNFSIKSSLPSQKFLTNTAANIVYIVTGSGNIKYMKLPELNALYPEALEVYSPDVKTDTKVEGNNVTGISTFDYSFVPMETGSFEIPDVKLVYFNPEKGTYETAVARGYNIPVNRGEASDKSQVAVRFDSAPASPEDFKKVPEEPWVYGWLYWLWFIIPSVGLIGAIIGHRYYVKSHSDLIQIKSRKASKMAMRRLKRAASKMASGDAEGFYDEMLSSLWGYLAHKLKMSTSELTRQNVLEVLENHGLSKEESTPILRLLDDCEFAKYSPVASAKSMDEIYEEGVNVIDNLELSFKKNIQKKHEDEINDSLV